MSRIYLVAPLLVLYPLTHNVLDLAIGFQSVDGTQKRTPTHRGSATLLFEVLTRGVVPISSGLAPWLFYSAPLALRLDARRAAPSDSAMEQIANSEGADTVALVNG